MDEFIPFDYNEAKVLVPDLTAVYYETTTLRVRQHSDALLDAHRTTGHVG
jgi:hypothetical protein